MKFNVNNYVRVRLTEVGKKILLKEYEEDKKFYPDLTYRYEPDAEGFVKFQMWDLMQIFGVHMGNGCDIPFETNIELEENE